MLVLRAGLLERVREFFRARGLLEVETPALSDFAVTDVHLESLAVTGTGGESLGFLHTSPEFPMKRLVAAGIGDCWQLARVFRGGERGRRHNPEFSLLEWYRVGWTAEALMGEVAQLLAHLGTGLARVGTPVTMTYRQAVRRHAGVDPLEAPTGELVEALKAAGLDPPAGLESDRDACLDLLLSAVVEPALDPARPSFIHDFPASQAALARIRPGDPPVAERFELFYGGFELANGFRELTDAREQADRFRADLDARARKGLPAPPVDHRFLGALEAGLPDCAGVAVGFDRVVMALTGADSINDVLAFPRERA